VESVTRRAAALIAGFVEWWLGELWGLVPSFLRRRLTRSRQRIVLVLGTSEASLRLEANRTSSALGRFALGDEDAAAAALATLIEESALAPRLRDGSAEACLRIPAGRSLTTIMRLPVAAKGNLDEVVEFELDRHTPFRPDQVLFAARLVGEDAEAGLLDAEVILVPRQAADAAVAQVQRLGFSPTRIDVAAPEGDEPATGNLLRAGRDATWSRGDKRVVAGLAAAAIVLAIIAASLPIVLAQRAEDALTERLAAVKRRALEAASIEKKIDELRHNELFLADRRRTTPTVSQLLFDTTHVLPDDTSLIAWQVAGDEVQLQGVTQSAAGLIGVLEHSKVFERSGFKSPVTQEPNGGERFNIATHVASGNGS
jgi:general secretion pathway protein L